MQIVYTTAFLTSLVAANPQWGGGHGGDGNARASGGGAVAWAAFPSCVSSCQQQNVDFNNYTSFCTDTNVLNTLNECVDGSDCSDQDKSGIRQTIAQLCANAGATITAAPYATFSVTSGGAAWPSAWTTNSAWVSAVSDWSNGAITAAPFGWHGGSSGPFGHGGPGGQGWGSGPWSSAGNWTNGPWTKWWGTNVCPPSTWTGWTEGTWRTSAPWTTWSACTAEVTATSVYTTTITQDGNIQTSVGTSYGYARVAEGTQSASTDDDGNNAATSTDANGNLATSDSGAVPTDLVALAGSAVGVFGILAGALLL